MIEKLVDQVLAHAYETPQHECCGVAVVHKGKYKYIPCKNELTGDTFSISAKEYAEIEDAYDIIGICHSHINIPAIPSVSDVIACNSSKLPWLIVSIPSNTYHVLQPENKLVSLIGREFYHGVHDCFSLARDYYSQELNIVVPDFKRSNNWWDTGEDIITKNFESYGFYQVSDLEKHDVIIMQIGSKVPNHIAVYLGNDTILHHCINRLSSRDIYDSKAQKASKLILRHKDLK